VESRITVAGETLELLSGRAVYWRHRRTLIVADLHLGKAAAFRAAGIPLPGGTTDETLKRLSSLIQERGAERVVLLGDLFHARQGLTQRTLESAMVLFGYTKYEWLLVRGNHDLRAGDPPAEWGIHCQDAPYVDPPFAFCHEPEPSAHGYVLAGHLHPAITLAGKGGQVLRLPCFHFTDQVGTLPAFGEFTGSATIRPAAGDQVYVVAGDEVVKVEIRSNE
jgi:uncharacterized protein